ncbi:MAG: hypothetical protein WC617_01235 [Rhodanobacter sp.]|jgi:hypothetical protein
MSGRTASAAAPRQPSQKSIVMLAVASLTVIFTPGWSLITISQPSLLGV